MTLLKHNAGDTYLYDVAARSTKHAREQEALRRINETFPHFDDLAETVERYEARGDAESTFVYALDKLIDPLNIYLEGGLLWHEKGVTLDMLLAKKYSKVDRDPTVKALFDELVVLLKEQPGLFPVTK